MRGGRGVGLLGVGRMGEERVFGGGLGDEV